MTTQNHFTWNCDSCKLYGEFTLENDNFVKQLTEIKPEVAGQRQLAVQKQISIAGYTCPCISRNDSVNKTDKIAANSKLSEQELQILKEKRKQFLRRQSLPAHIFKQRMQTQKSLPKINLNAHQPLNHTISNTTHKSKLSEKISSERISEQTSSQNLSTASNVSKDSKWGPDDDLEYYGLVQ